MKTYYGNYNVNNGQHVEPSYEFTSLRDARKTMREIASGNLYAGNSGSWSVTDDNGNVVASGLVR